MAHLFFADMECNTLAVFTTKSSTSGIIAASNEQSKTGTYSLKSNITVTGGNAYVNALLLDAPHTEIYTRFYYYFPTATYDTLDVINDSFRLIRGVDASYVEIFHVDMKNDAGTIKLIYDYSPGTDSIICPSRDAWHCIEFYHKRDAAAGAWQWWVDGVSEGSGSGINTGANNCKYVYFAIAASAGMTGAIYLDNMVIATSRIYELMGNIPQGNALRKRVESPQGWII